MKEETHAPERIATPTPETQPQQPETVFSKLIQPLQRAVAKEGYVTPTPIQEQCIPHLLEQRDLLGCAQTGTGKTAAFVLPLLQRFTKQPRRPRKGTPRALILAPTRELAAQIGDSIQGYGRFLRLRHTVIFGGVNQFHQVRSLNRGVDLLVATPGRLLDLIQQGHIHLDEVEVFVLDEVDRMLDMGFIPDIQKILSKMPEERQTLFFSATMAPKIVKLAYTMVKDPVQVTITPEKPTLDSITQKVLFVDKRNKDELLLSLLRDDKVEKVLIFTQMKHAANRVVETLYEAGIRATAIHGNKSQAARTRALTGFKQGRVRALVATDVAARGLDVDDITHVINYDLPVEAETYVHRIGRTARAGATGDAISFCSVEERAYLRDIERLLGVAIPADLEHAFHCETARRSRQPAPRAFGRNNRGRRRSGQPSGSRGSRERFSRDRNQNGGGGEKRRTRPNSNRRRRPRTESKKG